MSNDFIPFAIPDIGEEEIEAATAAMRSGWLTTGPNAAAFEQEFARYIGAEHAVAVNSATAGLHLALESSGVGPGDEVIVPTWTFTATAEVVRYLGAEPVLVDVRADTLNIDLEAAERAVTPRTKAVMPVHFAGLPVDRMALGDFAAKHSLLVIEDAAHTLPARSQGQMVGSGDSLATVFSFYATKTITTGEGGMVATPHEDVARRIRAMRLHGISRDVFDRYRSTKPAWFYEVVAPGYKYNLPDPAAAMGRVQLTRADSMRDRREALARGYDEAFAGLPIVRPAHAPADGQHSWHLYVCRLNEGSPARDEVIQALADRGVGTSVHFIPLHLHPYWREHCGVKPEDFPVATEEFGKAFSLPLFSSMTTDQHRRVTESLHEVLAG